MRRLYPLIERCAKSESTVRIHGETMAASSTEMPAISVSLDPEHITASIAHGELTIRLQKNARAEPRRIKLTSGLAAKMKGLLTSDRDKNAA